MQILICTQENSSTELGKFYPVIDYEFRGQYTPRIILKNGTRFTVHDSNQVFCGASDNRPVFKSIEIEFADGHSPAINRYYLGQQKLLSESVARGISALAILDVLGKKHDPLYENIVQEIAGTWPCKCLKYTQLQADLKNSGLTDEWLEKALEMASDYVIKH